MFISVLSVGCSSDSDSLPINEENLLGKWYYTGHTVDNGPFQYNEDSCPTSRDYQDILSSHNINYYLYAPDCELTSQDPASWTLEGNQFTVVSPDPIVVPSVYTILSITDKKMVLKRDFHFTSPTETETYKYYFTRN